MNAAATRILNELLVLPCREPRRPASRQLAVEQVAHGELDWVPILAPRAKAKRQSMVRKHTKTLAKILQELGALSHRLGP